VRHHRSARVSGAAAAAPSLAPLYAPSPTQRLPKLFGARAAPCQACPPALQLGPPRPLSPPLSNSLLIVPLYRFPFLPATHLAHYPFFTYLLQSSNSARGMRMPHTSHALHPRVPYRARAWPSPPPILASTIAERLVASGLAATSRLLPATSPPLRAPYTSRLAAWQPVAAACLRGRLHSPTSAQLDPRLTPIACGRQRRAATGPPAKPCSCTTCPCPCLLSRAHARPVFHRPMHARPPEGGVDKTLWWLPTNFFMPATPPHTPPAPHRPYLATSPHSSPMSTVTHHSGCRAPFASTPCNLCVKPYSRPTVFACTRNAICLIHKRASH
jgi:hypothetical protein